MLVSQSIFACATILSLRRSVVQECVEGRLTHGPGDAGEERALLGDVIKVSVAGAWHHHAIHLFTEQALMVQQL